MKFQVKEVKLLGSQDALSYLSLRLDAVGSKSDSQGPVKFTIHAVVPYDIAGLKPPRVGDEFSFALLV